MKNVVLIHNIISPHVNPVFRELAKKVNLTVLYCAQSEDNRSWDEKPLGFNYKVLKNKPLKFSGKDLFTYFINLGVTKELENLNPDVVIVSGWDQFAYQAAYFYCKAKKIKFILWSGSTEYENSIKRLIAKPLVKTIVKGADAYIAYGTRAKEYLEKLGANPKKIFISLNTTDVKFYEKEVSAFRKNREEIKQRLGLGNKKVILFYGQLIERKGIKTLLEAFAKIVQESSNVGLIIVGSGKSKSNFFNQAKRVESGLIKFVDDPGDKKISELYAIADIFVLPSYEEVWGLVINQAIAAKLPVITTSVVGAGRDLVFNGKNGYIVPPKKSGLLYDKIRVLLANPREKFEKYSLRVLERINPKRTVEGILEAIQSV